MQQLVAIGGEAVNLDVNLGIDGWWRAVVAGVTGPLSPGARVLTALLPILLVAAYMLVGLLVFAGLRLGRRHPEPGTDGDGRSGAAPASASTPATTRVFLTWLASPFWNLLVASRIPATAVTTLAGLLGLGAGVAVAAGRFALGGWLFAISGILDALDGRIARFRNEATPAGAAIDSVLDRYIDTIMLCGLAWYYHQSWILLPVLAAILGTSLVPYVRAKSEAMGHPVRGGLMQRPQRIAVLGASVALSPILEALFFPADPHPHHWLAVSGIVVLAVASNATALWRFIVLLRLLGGAPGRLLVKIGPATVAAIAATLVDYAVVSAAVTLGGTTLPFATAEGCLVGAVLNFSLNRVWAFGSHGPPLLQLQRYALVSLSSLLLNAGAVALLSLHLHTHHALIWWPARALVFLMWNLPLQRDYVFAPIDPNTTKTTNSTHAPSGGDAARPTLTPGTVATTRLRSG